MLDLICGGFCRRKPVTMENLRPTVAEALPTKDEKGLKSQEDVMARFQSLSPRSHGRLIAHRQLCCME